MVARKQRKYAPCKSSLPNQSVVRSIEFRSGIIKNFNLDRKGWRRREYEYLQHDRRTRERQLGLPEIDLIAPEAPGKVASISGDPNNEQTDFNSLQDYSPPMFILDDVGFPVCDWKGEPFDLSEDPEVHLLHAEEIFLAASLRMDCATYLTNKRRIFIACVELMKVGKEFKKTNSQKACNVDVNKASKLWEAFNTVGWFEKRHFSRVIRRHQWYFRTGGYKIF